MIRIQFNITRGPNNNEYGDLDGMIESSFPNGGCITAGLIDDDFDSNGLQWAFYCKTSTAMIKKFMAEVGKETQTVFMIQERPATQEEIDKVFEVENE